MLFVIELRNAAILHRAGEPGRRAEDHQYSSLDGFVGRCNACDEVVRHGDKFNLFYIRSGLS